ncbi:hypothetical protein DEU56DRAFT_983271 [Suillus clintonianus]|uniref:uncharacterized protein n=1 Tax=Suillus clintonianus TaxID=1904413 RepID=UPI001B880805|nr:uncharacterized protein DEU56DRAFT_983271 [Suillus clintonianus]KAG2125453.1 hypothetical protein DEU56DRAFT_983271 [Suillus clintonianus]
MHQALCVSEILLEISSHLTDHEVFHQFLSSSWTFKSPMRKSLTALASTCKTFHGPAMDSLWSNILGLEPLFSCVTRLHPILTYDPSNETNYSRSASWSRGVDPLTEHEIHQFSRHSTRARNIYMPTLTGIHFHLLTAFPVETCMFPQLLSLRWGEGMNTAPLHIFLSPTLRHLVTLDLHSDLKYIGTRCAALEVLTAYTYQDARSPVQLSEIVRSCKRLKHLDCHLLDSAGWMHLSTVPTLLTVQFTALYTIHGVLGWDKLDIAPFLNLTTLYFHGGDMEDILAIIHYSEFPSLKTFKMEINVLPWAQAEQLFCALSQCKASRTLEDIDITTYGRVQEDADNSWTAVRQLVCFTQLRRLNLYAHCPIYLDNDLFFEAMSNWPHIHTLFLLWQHPSPSTTLSLGQYPSPPTTLTFRGLSAALRQCPHLEDLSVYIDPQNVDFDPEGESFQHTCLKSLSLDSSAELSSDEEAVARIIFSMFPCVERVFTGDSYPWFWGEVNTCLESLRKGACLSAWPA